MADKAIGDLERSERLYTADLIPIEQGGNAKAITGAILAAFARERGAQAAEGAESYAEAAEESARKAESWSKHPPYIGANGNWWVYDTSTERFVDSGVDASITVRIADITMLAEGDAPYVTNTGTTSDPVFHLFIPIGATGATGNGIQSIRFNNDYTLTITYTNGTTYRTGAIRGATGNGISTVQLNQDYTLTINYTDGNSDTTASIRGEKGEKGDTGNDGVSPNVTITNLSNGHRVTITDRAHQSGQSFDVFNGTGAGDMRASTYDPNGNVAAAGGIKAFIDGNAQYTAGNGVAINANREISIKVDSNSSNGLSVSSNGLAMALASAGGTTYIPVTSAHIPTVYMSNMTYYTDSTGTTEVDTDGFVDGVTDVSSYYVVYASMPSAGAISGADKRRFDNAYDMSSTNAQDIADLKSFIGYTDNDIYGVEADFENKIFTRLASTEGLAPWTPFDELPPFGGRRRCNLTDGGVVLAYYGDEAYTEKGALTQVVTKGGTTYPAGTAVQVMVEQPKFYYKVVPLKLEKVEGAPMFHIRKARYYISETYKPGFKLHPLFLYNGVENDRVYLSAYEGCVWDTSDSVYNLNDNLTIDFTISTGDKLSSIRPAKPVSGYTQNLTRGNARILAHNRGTGWELHTVQAMSASQLLMMIEYAGFNMQTAIGPGNVNGNTGATNLSRNTGATWSFGNETGVHVVLEGSNRISLVTYRGEENLWGNMRTYVDGANVSESGRLYITDHGFAEDTVSAPYADTGLSLPKTYGYISAFAYNQNFDWLFFPSELNANGADSALPVGDQYYFETGFSGVKTISLGGSWSAGLNAGAFCYFAAYPSSHHGNSFGARMMYYPKTT